MNDRYLFRGHWLNHNKNTFEWVFGFYVYELRVGKLPHDSHYIVSVEGSYTLVQQDSVCQCTCSRDINLKLIFEGDIVVDSRNYVSEVTWVNDRYMCAGKHGFTPLKAREQKVIGNIHDNPELLKEAANESNI